MDTNNPLLSSMAYIVFFFVYFHKLTYVNTEVNEIWIKEKICWFRISCF